MRKRIFDFIVSRVILVKEGEIIPRRWRWLLWLAFPRLRKDKDIYIDPACAMIRVFGEGYSLKALTCLNDMKKGDALICVGRTEGENGSALLSRATVEEGPENQILFKPAPEKGDGILFGIGVLILAALFAFGMALTFLVGYDFGKVDGAAAPKAVPVIQGPGR